MSLWAQEQGMALRHIGLIYPAIDPGCDSASAHELGSGFIRAGAFMQWCLSAYLGHGDDPLLRLHAERSPTLPPISHEAWAPKPIRRRSYRRR